MRGYNFADGCTIVSVAEGHASQSHKEGIMDRTIAHLNINRYKELLKRETDESKRQRIMLLLADEEAKLLDEHDPTTLKRSA